jgi:hypothetical protein
MRERGGERKERKKKKKRVPIQKGRGSLENGVLRGRMFSFTLS